jgi:hypothetical protein
MSEMDDYNEFNEEDDDFELLTKLNILKENITNKQIEKVNKVEEIRKEKINKLRLEEENVKAIYETQMREIEERMYVLINTSDVDLLNNEFNIELNEMEIKLNKIITRKDRRAIALGLRIGDTIKIGDEWLCVCIGLEKKGKFGILKSPNNEVYQGQEFKSLNKIYQLYIKTFGKKRRSIFGAKNVEWFRDGKSLGAFI